MSDPVKHPNHYTQGGIETISAIKACMSSEEFLGYLRGNTLKYLWRYRHKGGLVDLDKAIVYLEWLREAYSEFNPHKDSTNGENQV
jgi:hypothetical protein